MKNVDPNAELAYPLQNLKLVEAQPALRAAIVNQDEVERGLWQAGAMTWNCDLVDRKPFPRGTNVSLEDLRDMAPPGATEGVFAGKWEEADEDDPRTMAALSCPWEKRPKYKGYKVALRYLGQPGDDAVKSLDSNAVFDYPLQHRHLPMPASWERLLDKFCGWSERQDARNAEVQVLEADFEQLKTLPGSDHLFLVLVAAAAVSRLRLVALFVAAAAAAHRRLNRSGESRLPPRARQALWHARAVLRRPCDGLGRQTHNLQDGGRHAAGGSSAGRGWSRPS